MRAVLPVLGLLLCGCPARTTKDVDVDGIASREDQCPEAPETPNGWRDEDGCPDALARLLVRVILGGEPVPGASVSLPGASPVLTDADGRAAFFELFPVERGVFVHVQSDALVRDVQTPLAEGENRLLVDLTP